MHLSFPPDSGPWVCRPCGQALQPCKVDLAYLGNSFQVELFACPACGRALVPESLALGRMREVEKLLEDK